MTAPTDTCAPAAVRTADEDVTQAITVFTDVLEQLQDSHRLLEARALHMEAELCRTNGELEAKVEELDRVKRHLEAVLTAIPTGVVVYDAAGRVIRANDAATEILGTDRTDLADASAMAAVAGDVTVEISSSNMPYDAPIALSFLDMLSGRTEAHKAKERE